MNSFLLVCLHYRPPVQPDVLRRHVLLHGAQFTVSQRLKEMTSFYIIFQLDSCAQSQRAKDGKVLLPGQ
jgi:hypothetical protein